MQILCIPKIQFKEDNTALTHLLPLIKVLFIAVPNRKQHKRLLNDDIIFVHYLFRPEKLQAVRSSPLCVHTKVWSGDWQAKGS